MNDSVVQQALVGRADLLRDARRRHRREGGRAPATFALPGRGLDRHGRAAGFDRLRRGAPGSPRSAMATRLRWGGQLLAAIASWQSPSARRRALAVAFEAFLLQ